MAETDIKVESLPKKSKLNMLVSIPAISFATMVCFATIAYMGMNNRNMRLEAVKAQRLNKLGSMNLDSTLADCARTRTFLISRVPQMNRAISNLEAEAIELREEKDKCVQEHPAAMEAIDEKYWSIDKKLQEADIKITNLETELQQYGVTPRP